MNDKRRLEAVELGPPRRRSHSTISFPYVDLGACERLTALVAANGGACRPEQLAAWLGHSTLHSGAYRNKVAAAGLFGFIDAQRNRVALTELGERVLIDELKRQARVEGFLSVPLYLKVFERHRAGRLPSAVGLEQELVNLGVTRTQVRAARQVLERSAEQAGFFEAGEHQLVLPRGTSTASEQAIVEAPGAAPPPPAPAPERRYPKLIEATLEEAPWDGDWTREEFEDWAELFVRAARMHFGFKGGRRADPGPGRPGI